MDVIPAEEAVSQSVIPGLTRDPDNADSWLQKAFPGSRLAFHLAGMTNCETAAKDLILVDRTLLTGSPDKLAVIPGIIIDGLRVDWDQISGQL